MTNRSICALTDNGRRSDRDCAGETQTIYLLASLLLTKCYYLLRWMILRNTTIVLIVVVSNLHAEFCGNNRIPFGIEVHKDGHIILLCSRPNCHEKKYAECPERAEETSCSSNTSWVGGLQKTIDGQLFLQCCEYPLMEKYGQLMFTNVGAVSTEGINLGEKGVGGGAPAGDNRESPRTCQTAVETDVSMAILASATPVKPLTCYATRVSALSIV
ncbi:hypothetical protein Y032_0005g2490 [Ancylostoma ceylanicum]|uniref:Uncharacterized protein n=1 Tax=Ancylostoma ceylanicum TaxID=53326 RepID=A0A016VRH6_9BILA|nr:hypothetical protein Y032_0005g2490 [Ancylostoma ceylanicum]